MISAHRPVRPVSLFGTMHATESTTFIEGATESTTLFEGATQAVTPGTC